MAKGFFTALYNALTDPKSYYAMQKEMNLHAVAQTFFNSLAGKTSFQAIILPEDIGAPVIFDGTKAVRVRPLGIYDLIIPEPCEFKDIETRKRMIALHPIAYPVTDGEKIEESFAQDLRTVECFFGDGPQSSGRLRQLKYRPNTVRSFVSSTGTNFDCLKLEETPQELKEKFDNGEYEEFVGPPAPGSGVLGDLRPSESEYVKKSTSLSKIRQTADYKLVKKHYGRDVAPRKKTYHGKLKQFVGKKFENGVLPYEMIGQSTSAAGYPVLMLKDIVEDFDKLAKAFEAKFNQKLVISGKTIDGKLIPSGTYRTFEQQVRVKADKIRVNKAGEASKPGKSNHGWGLAFDFSTHYKKKSGFQSETYKWMLKNAPTYGFENPYSLRDGKGWDEAWHIQWIKMSDIWR
jgi:hypothetical protein|tara:strand:+ start:971 stop:2179 length:1209 start_codon:yes stop_codon:yes gene_type:complete